VIGRSYFEPYNGYMRITVRDQKAYTLCTSQDHYVHKSRRIQSACGCICGGKQNGRESQLVIRHGANYAIPPLVAMLLVNEIVPGEEVWDGGKLRTVPCSIVIEFKERYGEKLHVFGHSKDFSFGHLHQVQFLAFFRFRDVCRNERVHECLKIGPPPLSKAVADLPFIV